MRALERNREMRSAVLLLCMLFLVPGSLTAQNGAGSSSATLRPGDAVQLSVWRNPELSGEFSISDAGTIAHPLLDKVHIAGVPIPEARARVHAYLALLDSNPEFVLEPLFRVSVGGEVRQPSLYRLHPSTSLAEAVAIAGGVSERGRMDHVRLYRGGAEFNIDLTRPEAGLAQESIRSGDQLFVERRGSIWRDYITPAGSLTAAVVSLIGILTR